MAKRVKRRRVRNFMVDVKVAFCCFDFGVLAIRRCDFGWCEFGVWSVFGVVGAAWWMVWRRVERWRGRRGEDTGVRV